MTACQAQAKGNKIDVVSYNIPSGFSAESEGNASARAFTKKYGGGKFAFITLYASTGSFGDANTDFSRRWKQLLAGMAQNKAVPQAERSNVSGITILNGYSNIVYEGSPAIGLLTTLTVNGRLITIVGIFNDKQGQKDYQAFLDGLDIDDALVNQKPANVATKPSSQSRPTNVVATQSGGNSRVVGYWEFHDNRGIPAIALRKYLFKSDGTFFGGIYTKTQPGRYQVDGNNFKLIYQDGKVEEYKFTVEDTNYSFQDKPTRYLILTGADGGNRHFQFMGEHPEIYAFGRKDCMKFNLQCVPNK